MKVRLRVRVPVHEAPTPESPIVIDLEPGTDADLGKTRRVGKRDWVEVRLTDGRRGFVDGDIQCFTPKVLCLRQPGGADLRSAPKADAPVLRRLAEGEQISSMDLIEQEGRSWLHVRDAQGVEGYLFGETLVQEKGGDLLQSILGGAGIILCMAGVGALVLCLRGQVLGALILVTGCAVCGGLAGFVFWLVRPLMASLFAPHLAWMLIINTYLSAAGLAICLFGGATSAADPLLWSILAGVGMLGGLYLGYATLNEQRKGGRRIPLAAWITPLVGAAGLVLLGMGAYFLLLYWQDWPVFSATAAEATDITLEDLLRDGPGANHHVRVKNFRYCTSGVISQESNTSTATIQYQWVPIIPAAGPPKELFRSKSARAKIPARIVAVVLETVYVQKNKKPEPPLFKLGKGTGDDTQAASMELQGYTGLVLNGLKPIPANHLEKLKELAPDTDPDQVLFIESHFTPISAAEMAERLEYAQTGLFAGGATLLLAVAWAWLAARAARRREAKAASANG
jgi:hypothetical protein